MNTQIKNCEISNNIGRQTYQEKTKQDWLLYGGIKSLLRCDEAEVVNGIARYVISQYDVLRIGAAFVERHRNTPIATVAGFLGAVTRFLEVRQSNKNSNEVVWVARLDNERRAIEPLIASLSQLNSTELEFHRRPGTAAVFAVFRRLLPHRRRIVRLTRLLLRRRQQFFKVLRVAEMIGYYTHYLDIFQKNNFSLAVMSSHSNPHGIAFNLAARKFNVPVALITHGMPIRPIARLSYDLAVVHCEIARQRYAEAGAGFSRVLIHGRRQDYAPMPDEALSGALTAGIFLCKDVNEPKLVSLVNLLLANPKVKQITIRPHPKNLWRGLFLWISSLNEARVRVSSAEFAADDLKTVDIVFGGNSSVLVEAVTSGRPSVYVADLDYGPPDLHEFVKEGLIYPFDELAVLDLNVLIEFYRRPEWIFTLQNFSNIKQDEAEIKLKTKTAIDEILERSGSMISDDLLKKAP